MRAFLMRVLREVVSYRGRFNAIAVLTIWVLISVALDIGESQPAFTADGGHVVTALMFLFYWGYAGYLIGSGKWRKGGAQ